MVLDDPIESPTISTIWKTLQTALALLGTNYGVPCQGSMESFLLGDLSSHHYDECSCPSLVDTLRVAGSGCDLDSSS